MGFMTPQSWSTQTFLRENMKYLCPQVLQGMIAEQQELILKVQSIMAEAGGALDQTQMQKMRKDKAIQAEELKQKLAAQTPLKWVDRVIMWCADKMPSFAAKVDGKDADECVTKALNDSKDVKEAAEKRAELITKYSAHQNI